MPPPPPPPPASAPDDGERAALRLLQRTAFVSTIDRFAMPPMLVAMAVSLDVPLETIVQIAGVYFLAYGLSQPLWGAVSDRLGRVRTLRLTLLIAGVCTVLSAAAWSPLSLAVTRGLAGGFFGAAYPSTLIYLGDTVPAARRQPQIAALMVGVALGTALASLAAGLLADLLTWRAAFVLTGLAALLLAWRLGRLAEPHLAPRVAPRHPVGEMLRSRATMLVLGLALVEGAVLLGALTLLPAAVEQAGASAALAGAATAAYGVAVFAGARAVGRLALAWHPWRLIAVGASLATLACSLLAVSRRPLVAAVVAVLLGLAWTSMHSSLQTWATEVLPTARATVVSFFASALFVGSSLGALLVADLAEAGRFDVVYASYAAITLPLGLVAAVARRRWRASAR